MNVLNHKNLLTPLMNQERKLHGSIWRSGLVTAFLVMGSGFPALAQLPPPGPAGVYPQSYAFSSVTSHIKRYLLTPQGLVSGLLLRNGLQVLLPPTLADNIESLAQPGDEVRVYGVPGIQTSFGQIFQAYSITNTNTQRTVVVPSLDPAAYGPPPGPRVAYGPAGYQPGIALPPIPLSPEGQPILCQQFPLNSRCVSNQPTAIGPPPRPPRQRPRRRPGPPPAYSLPPGPPPAYGPPLSP
ncbi:MAG: hypothetical protein JO235_06295 [Chroococcidiopsidaceae cyanobacterium CP_BM_RX_35]|nr:hypothetical protein [Chroococcidiopsidaceae cyanobacterium CP_BM_RX_35]